MNKDWHLLSAVKPKPGQLCLVCCLRGKEVDEPFRSMSYWDEAAGFYHISLAWSEALTHWMPYPELPQEISEQTKP